MRPNLYALRTFKAALVLARLLPRAASQRIAMLVARLSYARRPAAASALHENLQRVTGLSRVELEALCTRNVGEFSRMLADYFICAGRESSHSTNLVDEWRGFSNLEEALALGRGVIIVTAHLGNWEIGGTLLALSGRPLTVITLDEPSTELTRWRDTLRQQLGISTIIVGPGHDFAFVEMIQTLRRNEILAMLVDRPYAGTGSPVDFFGAPAEFSTGPARLWQHTDAAVLPAFVLRNERNRYTSFIDPMLPLARSGDPRADLTRNTQRIATHFENIIRQHPEQWYNYVPIWNSPPAAA
jgi:KDO2-lipid IV(A) lauroyltransferase